MGCLHLNVHILQIQNDIAAYILSQVDGTHIKIAGVLMGIGGRASFLICME